MLVAAHTRDTRERERSVLADTRMSGSIAAFEQEIARC